MFRRAGVEKGLIYTGHDSQQMTLLGHVKRKDKLEKVVLTGYVEGTRDRGNKEKHFLRISANSNV